MYQLGNEKNINEICTEDFKGAFAGFEFFKCEKPYFPISSYGEQGLLSTDQLNRSQCG